MHQRYLIKRPPGRTTAAPNVTVDTVFTPYTVHFAWNANPPGDNVIGYRLYVGRVSGDYSVEVPAVEMGNTTTGSYVIQRPSGLGLWYFALVAYNSGGQSSFSPEVSLDVGPG